MKKNVKLLCIVIIGVLASMLLPKQTRANDTKIFVMFRSEGRGHEVDWDAEDVQRILTNEEILNELEKRCEGVEFIGETNVVGIESAVKNLNQEKNLDGIVVFGPPPNELIETGLPIITVYRMFQTWMVDFNFQAYKGKKILFDCVPMVRDTKESAFSKRMDGLAKKIKLIQAISKMGYRILVITDESNFLGGFEPETDEYARVFRDNTSEIFGTEFTKIPIEELFYKIKEIDKQKAEDYANRWIDGAYAIKNTNKTQIIESAKVYLAMKVLKEKYNCDAVTTEGYGIFRRYKKGLIASQGLAATQFSTDGWMTPGETLINSMLTQQIGYYITGKGGFNGDYAIDPFYNIAMIQHCECPLNMLGDDAKNCTYTIRNMPYRKKNEGGAVVQVNLPTCETVTVVRLSMYDKKIAVFTGKTVSKEQMYIEVDEPGMSCRTKLAIKADTKALLENLDWKTFGSHRVVFYGDYREEIKNLATLMGFEVEEEVSMNRSVHQILDLFFKCFISSLA